MKIKKIIILILCVVCLFACACDEEQTFDDKVKVVFSLEGGIYQNSKRDVVHYYSKSADGTLIATPDSLSEKPIEKSGFILEGWYATKTVDGEDITYSDKWDFSSDKIYETGVTLYAKWEKAIKFTYAVCYYDENGEIVKLGEYPVSEGEKFDDYARYASRRTGYTALGFIDENGNPWNNDFTHPGGESSVEIKVFVSYIQGRYKLVSTAKQLLSAVNDNIYLLCDIDMGGQKLRFENYSGKFMGNGFTVSNFEMDYDASRYGLQPDLEDDNKDSLYISLFGDMKNATISSVNFTGVTINIKTTLTRTYKIYLAPLGISATNSTLENVTFSGRYAISALPSDRTEDEMITIVTDSAFISVDSATVQTGVEITLIKQD